jgi:hypothetical protein
MPVQAALRVDGKPGAPETLPYLSAILRKIALR